MKCINHRKLWVVEVNNTLKDIPPPLYKRCIEGLPVYCNSWNEIYVKIDSKRVYWASDIKGSVLYLIEKRGRNIYYRNTSEEERRHFLSIISLVSDYLGW